MVRPISNDFKSKDWAQVFLLELWFCLDHNLWWDKGHIGLYFKLATPKNIKFWYRTFQSLNSNSSRENLDSFWSGDNLWRTTVILVYILNLFCYRTVQVVPWEFWIHFDRGQFMGDNGQTEAWDCAAAAVTRSSWSELKVKWKMERIWEKLKWIWGSSC